MDMSIIDGSRVDGGTEHKIGDTSGVGSKIGGVFLVMGVPPAVRNPKPMK
jgi:hypothetical protein